MNKPDINIIYYIIIVFFIFAFLYYLIMPKDKFFKYFSLARGYKDKFNDYDWQETIRRQKKYIFLSIIYLIIFLLLSNYINDFVGKFGLVLYAILSIFAGIWIGPVKKR